MADENKKILIEINTQSVDVGKTTQEIEKLTKRNLELKDEIKKLDKTDKDYVKNLTAKQAEVKKNNQSLRDLNHTVKNGTTINNTNADSYENQAAQLALLRKRIRTFPTDASKMTDSQKAIVTEANNLNDKLKGVDESVGFFGRNVGNYANSVMSAMEKMGVIPHQFGQIAGSIFNMEKATTSSLGGFKALNLFLKANLIGLILTLVGAIATFFTKTERGRRIFESFKVGLETGLQVIMDKFAELGESVVTFFSNPIENIKESFDNVVGYLSDTILPIFENLGQVILNIFDGEKRKEAIENLKKSVKVLTDDVGDLADGFKKSGDEIVETFNNANKAAQAAIKIQNDLQKLEDQKRNLSVKRAKQDRELAEARLRSQDDENLSAERRIDILEEIIRTEQALTNQEVANAEARLARVKQLNALADSSTQDLERQANLEIEVEQARARSQQQQLRAVRELNRLKNEAASEDQTNAIETAQVEADIQGQALESLKKNYEERKFVYDKELAEQKARQKAWDDTVNESKGTAIESAEAIAFASGKALGEVLTNSDKGIKEFFKTLIISTLKAAKAQALIYAAGAFTVEVGTKGLAGVLTGALAAGLIEGAFAGLEAKIQGLATGGIVEGGTAINRSNGDNRLITARTGEAVVTPQQQRIIGYDRFAAAGVPGFASGGIVPQPPIRQSNVTNVVSQPVLVVRDLSELQGRMANELKISRN